VAEDARDLGTLAEDRHQPRRIGARREDVEVADRVAAAAEAAVLKAAESSTSMLGVQR